MSTPNENMADFGTSFHEVAAGSTQQQMMTVDLEALGSTTEYNSIRIVLDVTDGTADSISCVHYTTGLHNRPGNVTDQWLGQQRTTN